MHGSGPAEEICDVSVTWSDGNVGKGLLRAEKVRHLTLYGAAITREQARRGELRYTLKHAFDGALTPLVQCLLDGEKVSSADLDELEALIRARRKRK